jgi:hypothetical protein
VALSESVLLVNCSRASDTRDRPLMAQSSRSYANSAVVTQHHLHCLIGQRHAPISETKDAPTCAGSCVDVSCPLSSQAAVMAQRLPAALHLNASAMSCRINRKDCRPGWERRCTLNDIVSCRDPQRLIDWEHLPGLLSAGPYVLYRTKSGLLLKVVADVHRADIQGLQLGLTCA